MSIPTWSIFMRMDQVKGIKRRINCDTCIRNVDLLVMSGEYEVV